MTNAKRDGNHVPALTAVSTTDGAIVRVTADPTTGALQTSTSVGGIDSYAINDTENATDTLEYIGREKSGGNYLIQSIDTSSGSGTEVRYATIVNNPSVNTYATAWAGRAGLTYDLYSIAF